MKLHILPQALTVCRLPDTSPVTLPGELCFFGRTDEELSLVCPTDCVPSGVLAREDGWRAFRITGVLDFSLIGILAPIARILADAGIGIFAVSTFNTDYILVKADRLDDAIRALTLNGYAFE